MDFAKVDFFRASRLGHIPNEEIRRRNKKNIFDDRKNKDQTDGMV